MGEALTEEVFLAVWGNPSSAAHWERSLPEVSSWNPSTALLVYILESDKDTKRFKLSCDNGPNDLSGYF